MEKWIIGKEAPDKGYGRDGLMFELDCMGDMRLLIEISQQSPMEKQALMAGWESCSIYRHRYKEISLIDLVFKFFSPLSYADAPFHAGAYFDDRAQRFLQSGDNSVFFAVINDKIVSDLQINGFRTEFMDVFRQYVQQQLFEPLTSKALYYEAMDDLYSKMTPQEIFAEGFQCPRLVKH